MEDVILKLTKAQVKQLAAIREGIIEVERIKAELNSGSLDAYEYSIEEDIQEQEDAIMQELYGLFVDLTPKE